jgi:hypothetical protein
VELLGGDKRETTINSGDIAGILMIAVLPRRSEKSDGDSSGIIT